MKLLHHRTFRQPPSTRLLDDLYAGRFDVLNGGHRRKLSKEQAQAVARAAELADKLDDDQVTGPVRDLLAIIADLTADPNP